MKKQLLSLLLLVVMILLGPVSSPATDLPEKTLSPYFFIPSGNPELDQLPLKRTTVSVNISGVIADVSVSQTYQNEGRQPLEAIYVFPAATRAAVYAMKMTIGDRTIVAEVAKREDARQAYEAAKQQGKSASLLEQQRPNVFQMNVANILPGDVIVVELKYTELLVPQDAEYEFVFPTVVGPRYVDSAQDPKEAWTQNPYLHEGKAPTSTFNIDVFLEAGLPIQEVTCPSHQTTIRYDDLTNAHVSLDSSERHGGNRDYILKYRLAGKKIQTGLLLYEGETENHFLLMVQPPKSVQTAAIPPREYVFIVDISGSMHGFPLDTAKTLLKDLIGHLRPKDRFNVLLFAGSTSVLSERSLPATAENLQQAIHLIENQRGGGGTRLLPALQRALALPGSEEVSRNIIIATDGFISVEKETFDLIRNHLNRANVFPFGIGTSVNRYLIEGMARVGMGEPFVVTDPKDAPAAANRFRNLIQTPALTGVQVEWTGFDVYDVEPPSIPDVMADRPVIVFGKWRGPTAGRVQLTGRAGDQDLFHKIEVADAAPSHNNSALRYLWARHRIAMLSDYNTLENNKRLVEEVTQLGLSYNLLTAYTSFVAIDSMTRLENGKAETIKQPLPLPQGVTDFAVGSSALKAAPPALMRQSYSRNGVEKKCLAENFVLADKHRQKDDELGNGKKIHLLRLESTAGYSEKALRKAIMAQLEKTDCRGAATSSGPFVITVIANATGRIESVTPAENQTIDEALFSCLEKTLKKVKLPATPSVKKTVLTLTLETF